MRAGIRPRGCEALERIAQLRDPDARVGEEEGDHCVGRSFGRCCVHPGPFGDQGNGTTHIVGQDPFDERLAVSTVDSLALCVGESQLLAQSGRALGGG